MGNDNLQSFLLSKLEYMGLFNIYFMTLELELELKLDNYIFFRIILITSNLHCDQ